ncbi:hypothetical protein JW921_00380, partial [Candidatus Fermentibacterales bacterium]|nr:hypothetical protein [Candidatus Fermentibacterales bacterium]
MGGIPGLASAALTLLLLSGQVASEAEYALLLEGGPPLPDRGEQGIPDALPVLEDSLVLDLQEAILEWYLTMGYPFASVFCYLSATDTLSARVVAGRHANLEEVTVEGIETTRPRTLTRYLDIEPGEPYDPELVAEWLRAISRLPFVADL